MKGAVCSANVKICPECQERYDDDVGTCVRDGEELVDLPKALSGNPRLREPVAASPADRTSMIDLEAIEAKRRVKARGPEGQGDDATGGENKGDDERTPPPAEPLEVDGDATGTLHQARGKRPGRGRSKSALPTEVDAGVGADLADGAEIPADLRVNEELTNKDMATKSRTGRARVTMGDPTGTRTGMTSRAPRAQRKRSISGTQAAVLVMFGLLALLAAIVWFARATAVLTVTTVPPGAAVLLDGKSVGVSPMQKRVRASSHSIELALAGYEPFKEIVEVPSSGLPFLQPLQKLPPPPPPPATPAQIADELVRAAQAAFEGKQLAIAKSKLEEALSLHPGLPAATALATTVNTAIAARAAEEKRAAQSAASAVRLQQARVLAEEGRRLYDKGALGPAKEKLYASLKLDADNAEPHRTLGRIFNREEQIDKVRYHLQRFLDLGGADGDFKVREWLKAHPR